MIPEIGAMVGLYIVTRMAGVLLDKSSPALVRVFAVITLLAAVLVIVDLVLRGSTAAQGLEQYLPR